MRMLSADTPLTSHRAHRLSIHSPAAPTMPSAPTTISKKTAAVGIPSEITGASKLPRLRSASKTIATVTVSGRARTWSLLLMALTVVPIVPVSEAWRSLPELYSPKCGEGVSVLKNSLDARFRLRSGTKTPVLGRFEPDLWSLSAQSRLFQHAGAFCELRQYGVL